MITKHEEEFNVAVGRRLSLVRQTHKISLEQLSVTLGVSYQQVHKYEIGETALGARRLHICAKLFEVPVGYFFGEEESDTSRPHFDKSVLTIAGELQKLPEDIRKGVYHLSRQINKTVEDIRPNAEEHAA